ncbi:hypothetical protein MMC24_006744 [Lignoscripta atroalba]|nr:hypothetical protein [Lignoscripta atroalba]
MPLSRDVKKETNPASTSKASERQGNDTAGKGSAQPPMEQKKDPASTREAPPPRAKEREKTPRSAEMDAAESHPKEPADGPIREGPRQPLETVLLMERPSSEEHKHLHLHAPPYVHHFDTFTLVKDLEKGGFTQDQSVTLMKAVRSLLAVNLDVAKDGLISKSDVENETYLFRAACSELRTEIQNSRKSANEKMRTERAHLQHEVEILNQKLTQDSLSLKDDLRGMFNDRKMAVRMEQRGMESSIQELNYKIAVALNSDSKSEVEGLRWVLTRRAAMAIVSMAFLILGSLRYSSYRIHLQDQERKLAAKADASGSTSSTGSGGDTYTVPSREIGTQTGEPEAMLASMSMNSGSSPSYVSLG